MPPFAAFVWIVLHDEEAEWRAECDEIGCIRRHRLRGRRRPFDLPACDWKIRWQGGRLLTNRPADCGALSLVQRQDPEDVGSRRVVDDGIEPYTQKRFTHLDLRLETELLAEGSDAVVNRL